VWRDEIHKNFKFQLPISEKFFRLMVLKKGFSEIFESIGSLQRGAGGREVSHKNRKIGIYSCIRMFYRSRFLEIISQGVGGNSMKDTLF